VAARVQARRVERRERAIGQTLDHDGAGPGEAPPGLDRLWAREHDVARDEELVKAPPLGGGEHGPEGVELAVNVGKAEEEHGGERPTIARRSRLRFVDAGPEVTDQPLDRAPADAAWSALLPVTPITET